MKRKCSLFPVPGGEGRGEGAHSSLVTCHGRAIKRWSAAIAMIVAITALLAGAVPTHAIMAGASPDSPSARVDPNTTTSPWAGVGSLIVNGGTFSAVAIGPRHVLTAAHVVGDPAHMRFQLNFGTDASHVIPVSHVYKHPGFTGFNAQKPMDDLAVVELSEVLPADVPIYPLHREDLSPGTEFVMVGYGASGTGDVGVTVGANAAVKRVGRNAVDLFGADQTGRKLVFLFDFDGGDGPNLMGGRTLGNDVETTFAVGDSGSPSFVCEHGFWANCWFGHWAVAGINTFVSAPKESSAKPGTFGTVGGGVLVAPYVDWIEHAMSESNGAGAAPAPDAQKPQ